MAEEPGAGAASRRPSGAPLPGEGLGVAPGLIAGNSAEALPAPMSELETLFRFGTGPSGSVVPGAAGMLADGALAGAAPVTATVSAADGGVHLAVVVTLAVAVSVTEVTELAPAATGICAGKVSGCLSD